MMREKQYSQRLGTISDTQFQAALDRFHLGRFIHAEAISFGNFGQNVFVSSTTGEYVLRGQPHFWWQFPTEQFYTRQLHERTSVPVAWPYLFELASELAWPFSPESNAQLASREPIIVTYSERVKACLRHQVVLAQERNAAATTAEDIAWVEERIAEAQDALDEPFEPCFLMEDYKEGNLVVTQHGGRWHVNGVFDLMQGHFGDGEADLSRQIGEYLNEEPQLATAFLAAYRQSKPLRPGFASRFSNYMLLDRAILWAFFQGHGWRWWPEQWTFRDWASQYIFPHIIFDHL